MLSWQNYPNYVISMVFQVPFIRHESQKRPGVIRDSSIRRLENSNFQNIYTLYFLSDSRLYEAGYFYAISQGSNMTVNLVQLSEQGKNESPTASILRAMEEIENLETDIILLYTDTKNIEQMLQKV